jgi:hypothetical protein
LPPEKRRLIEQLFWEERTETDVAGAMGVNQSTINRRMAAILNGLRMQLRNTRRISKIFCINSLFVAIWILNNWSIDSRDRRSNRPPQTHQLNSTQRSL